MVLLCIAALVNPAWINPGKTDVSLDNILPSQTDRSSWLAILRRLVSLLACRLGVMSRKYVAGIVLPTGIRMPQSAARIFAQ
jgi:hypothetical protein